MEKINEWKKYRKERSNTSSWISKAGIGGSTAWLSVWLSGGTSVSAGGCDWETWEDANDSW